MVRALCPPDFRKSPHFIWERILKSCMALPTGTIRSQKKVNFIWVQNSPWRKFSPAERKNFFKRKSAFFLHQSSTERKLLFLTAQSTAHLFDITSRKAYVMFGTHHSAITITALRVMSARHRIDVSTSVLLSKKMWDVFLHPQAWYKFVSRPIERMAAKKHIQGRDNERKIPRRTRWQKRFKATDSKSVGQLRTGDRKTFHPCRLNMNLDCHQKKQSI